MEWRMIFVGAAALFLAARCLYLERKASRRDTMLSTVNRSYEMALYSLSLSADLVERLSREIRGTDVPKDMHGHALAYGQRVRFSSRGETMDGVVMLNIEDDAIDETCPLCVFAMGRKYDYRLVQGLTVVDSMRFREPPGKDKGRP